MTIPEGSGGSGSGTEGGSSDTNETYYVTPEQFGAVGDGTNDDTNAINKSLASGEPVYFSAKTYKVSYWSTMGDTLKSQAVLGLWLGMLFYMLQIYLDFYYLD